MSRILLIRGVGWVAWCAALTLFGGLVVGIVALAVAVWHLRRAPAPGTVLRAALVVMAAVPVAWLAGNATRLGEVTSDLVYRNLTPHYLAAIAISLLALGVTREVRAADVAGPRAEDRK